MRSLAAVLLFCLRSQAAIHYVSNSGSDSNNGTSTGTPWQTVGHVNAQAFAPGDSILFQCGGIWRDATLAPTNSGTALAVITFGQYGSCTGANNPSLDAANFTTWTNSSGNVWYASESVDPILPIFGNSPGVEVGSIGALVSANQYFFDSGANRVYVYNVGNPASVVEIPTRSFSISVVSQTYLTFIGIEMRGASGNGCFSGTVASSHITISGVIVELCSQDGIWFYDNINPQDYNTVTSCTVRNVGSTGIDINSDLHSNITVTHNYVSYFGLVGIGNSSAYTAGVKMFSYSGTGGVNSMIAYNVVSNGAGSGATSANGVGVWLDSPTGVTLMWNVSFGNASSGMFLEKTTGCTARYNVLFNNALYATFTANLAVYASGTGGGGSDAAFKSQNNDIEFNTMFNGGYWGLQLGVYNGFGPALFQNNKIWNNIVSGAVHEVVFFDNGANNNATNGVGNTYANNSFGAQATSFVNWVGSGDLNTYTALDSAYGSAMSNLQSAVSFGNSVSGDFRLPIGSPALTASSTGGIIGALGVVTPSLVSGAAVLSGNAKVQ